MRKFNFIRRIGEQVTTLLRRGFSWKFWNLGGRDSGGIVDMDLARELYENSNESYALGASFCKPIIDAEVEFIGIPRVATDDAERDDFLNDCIQTYWAEELQAMLRDACRDSKTVIRITQPDYLTNPLYGAAEIGRTRLEIIAPENVRIYYNPQQGDVIDQAVVKFQIPMLDTDIQPIDQPWNEPTETVHEISEVITPDRYEYYDHTAGEWLDSWGAPNLDGFVPLLEVFNEWDAVGGRGQSDLETVFPFIAAFHDVMNQSLHAHQYHSIPKVKFKLNDVDTFIRNNFPDAIDADGNFNGSVAWRGKEILFFQGGENGEDASFLEAKSILGDSKTLLEFLFDCICIASETPGWVFMRESTGQIQAKPADALRFVAKIKRKRKNFERAISMICRMALVIDRQTPVQVKFHWEQVRPDDELTFAQAFQMLVMGLEVAAQRGIISDETYRAEIRPFLATMKNPNQEERDAASNVVLMADSASQNGNTPVTTTAGAGGANE